MTIISLVLLLMLPGLLTDHFKTNPVELLENTLYIFVGLLMILIGELTKRLSKFENHLYNLTKVIFPEEENRKILERLNELNKKQSEE